MARGNSALKAKRLKLKAQTIEFAKDMAQRAINDGELERKALDNQNLVEAWLKSNKVTRCLPGKDIVRTFAKGATVPLGDDTQGRAALTYGYRHVYSR